MTETLLSDEMLRRIVPHCPSSTRAKVLPVLNKVCLDYEIVTELRIAAFIATLAVESGEFRYQEEIASGAAYEFRGDLGNTVKGDGVKYKGHGRIQITGKFNHAEYSKYLKAKGHLPYVDFVKEPKKLAAEPYATDSAAWFFCVKIKALPLCDKRDFLEIQLRVNGGRKRKPPRPNHWNERLAYYRKALEILPDNIMLKARDEVVEPILPDDEIPDFEQPEKWKDANPETDFQAATGFGSWQESETDAPEGGSTEIEVKDGNVKLKTSEGEPAPPPKPVVVEKPEPEGFMAKTWKQITAIFGGSALLDGLSEKLQSVQAFGLSPRFWTNLVYFALAAGAIWLIVSLYKHWQESRRQEKITEALINANSTEDNTVMLMTSAEIANLDTNKFTIVKR